MANTVMDADTGDNKIGIVGRDCHETNSHHPTSDPINIITENQKSVNPNGKVHNESSQWTQQPKKPENSSKNCKSLSSVVEKLNGDSSNRNKEVNDTENSMENE